MYGNLRFQKIFLLSILAILPFVVTLDADAGVSGVVAGDEVLDSLEVSSVGGFSSEVIHLTDNLFAFGYTDSTEDGHLATFTINSEGTISSLDDVQFITTFDGGDFLRMYDDVIVVFYRGVSDEPQP